MARFNACCGNPSRADRRAVLHAAHVQDRHLRILRGALLSATRPGIAFNWRLNPPSRATGTATAMLEVHRLVRWSASAGESQ